MEQKATREAGATTGTARNEKVERGSLEAGGEIERSLDGISSPEPYSAQQINRTFGVIVNELDVCFASQRLATNVPEAQRVGDRADTVGWPYILRGPLGSVQEMGSWARSRGKVSLYTN